MKKQNFAAHMAEDRRLSILLILAQSASYTANHFMVKTLLESFGHMVSTDVLLSDLAWLQEQQLITVNETAGVQLAKLTERGLDVSTARTTVPGVKRPQPL